MSHERVNFLTGHGALTVQEVIEWAAELDPGCTARVPSFMDPEDQVMVSVSRDYVVQPRLKSTATKDNRHETPDR